MLTISGVSAENIDDTSSVVTESPISADLDTSLSSCNAQNNDLSDYESSDSLECDNSHESSQAFDRDNLPIKGDSQLSDSHNPCVSGECLKSYDLVDKQVAYKSPDLLVSCDLDDSNICLESFDMPVINENINYGFDEVISTEKVVDNNVILKNCNSFSNYEVVIDSTNNLDEINIFDSDTQYLTQYEYIDQNMGDSIISEVTADMETSESYKFGSNVIPQVNNLLKCGNENTALGLVAEDLSEFCQISEPVFDGILISSGYISGEEVYFGTISDADMNMLLESVGTENIILFASLTDDWNSNAISEILKNVELNGSISEINLDGYKGTNALLKYCPSTNEVYLSFIGDGNEDEHSHVINDTNSHGLDYAYIKHVNVIYKDMPNLMVLTSSGYISNKRSTAGFWDSLNDVLGSRMSSETLLPDHKAIWTPLLLLLQQDLQESNVNSHADDNENVIMDLTANNTGNSSDNGSNSSGNHSHHHKHFPHHKHKHWGHHGCKPRHGYIATGAVIADINEHDNSTDDNESSNATAAGSRGKSSKSPKTKVDGGEPTYTLVYAIIGIILVSLLFNSSYMKRDD